MQPRGIDCFLAYLSRSALVQASLLAALYFGAEMAKEHDSDHSSPSSAEVKNVWSYTSSRLYTFMARTGNYFLIFMTKNAYYNYMNE